MIHPRITWAALILGIISIAGTMAPILGQFAQSSQFAGYLATLFGPVVQAHITAAFGLVAVACVIVAALGRSISPAVDAGKEPAPPAGV